MADQSSPKHPSDHSLSDSATSAPRTSAKTGSIRGVHDRPPPRARFAVRLELGLAAFAPVLGILAFRARSTIWLAAVLVVIAAIGLVFLLYIARTVAKGNSEPFTFTRIDDLGQEALGHVGAYLVPIVIDVGDSLEELLLGTIVLGLIIHIHIATGRVLVNPVLYLVGYQIYQATSAGSAYYLIARSDVSTLPDHQACIQITKDILVEKRTESIEELTCRQWMISYQRLMPVYQAN